VSKNGVTLKTRLGVVQDHMRLSIVPFSSFLTSSNSVTLKSGLGVTPWYYSKMLWIHYVDSISHLAKFCNNQAVTAREMLINLLEFFDLLSLYHVFCSMLQCG